MSIEGKLALTGCICFGVAYVAAFFLIPYEVSTPKGKAALRVLASSGLLGAALLIVAAAMAVWTS